MNRSKNYFYRKQFLKKFIICSVIRPSLMFDQWKQNYAVFVVAFHYQFQWWPVTNKYTIDFRNEQKFTFKNKM